MAPELAGKVELLLGQGSHRIRGPRHAGIGETLIAVLPRSPVYRFDLSQLNTIPLEPPMRGDLRLLVVDDEPGVRRNLTRLLRLRGFFVEEAADGPMAAELIRTSTTPFDLLITDIVMPGMTGFELAELARSISPSIKILLISAHTPAPPAGLERLPFLQKPFKLDLFLNTVRELVNSWTPPDGMPPLPE